VALMIKDGIVIAGKDGDAAEHPDAARSKQ